MGVYSTLREAGYLGDLVITTLQNQELLYKLGVLHDSMQFDVVVFDEVDAFYDIKLMPEFH